MRCIGPAKLSAKLRDFRYPAGQGGPEKTSRTHQLTGKAAR